MPEPEPRREQTVSVKASRQAQVGEEIMTRSDCLTVLLLVREHICTSGVIDASCITTDSPQTHANCTQLSTPNFLLPSSVFFSLFCSSLFLLVGPSVRQ